MKTAEQEKLEGNPGRRPENKSAPKPDPAILEPQKFLNRVATRAYHELVKIVGPEGMQVMAKTDSLALTMICDAYADYRVAVKTIDKYGATVENSAMIETGELDKKGKKITEKVLVSLKRNPAVGDKQNAWSRVMQGLSKFGMTPYDRKNVSILELLPEESPEEKKARDRADAKIRAKIAAGNKTHIQKVVNE